MAAQQGEAPRRRALAEHEDHQVGRDGDGDARLHRRQQQAQAGQPEARAGTRLGGHDDPPAHAAAV